VHAVRARPLLIIKNNIEPDEQREEADTIHTRGVNPESYSAPGLRPMLYTSVGLVATLLGLGYILIHVQGLAPLPIGCRPHGLCYSPRSHEDFSCSPARSNYHAPLSRKTIMRATRAILQGAQQRAKECPIGAPPLNAVRRSSLRAQPALHKPPQGGFFTTAQPFFTAGECPHTLPINGIRRAHYNPRERGRARRPVRNGESFRLWGNRAFVAAPAGTFCRQPLFVPYPPTDAPCGT